MNPLDSLVHGGIQRLQVDVSAEVIVAKVCEATLDFSECQRLRAELAALVADKSRVVIDLSAVHYVDFFGFELLLSAVKDCPGLLRYRGARPPLASLFHLCHLESLLETETDAL